MTTDELILKAERLIDAQKDVLTNEGSQCVALQSIACSLLALVRLLQSAAAEEDDEG